ncbi:hypothetical protein QUB56_35150 [Microcoleus sp. AR_TQ3_B6]|uniref:hypothetical protein n=1 Tax=Microcoleus sp. AR_TQ3_B6 TaxID=3055284 RepID=UPI002FD6631E
MEAAQLTAQADAATTATHRTALRWWWLIRLFCRRLLHARRPATLRIWLASASSHDSTRFKMLVALVRKLCREVNEVIKLIF